MEKRFIRPGTFIAAVGADSAEKHELEASLLAENKVVVDLLDQCARIGELHHALQDEVMTVEDVYGELGEVIAGVSRAVLHLTRSLSSTPPEWACKT